MAVGQNGLSWRMSKIRRQGSLWGQGKKQWWSGSFGDICGKGKHLGYLHRRREGGQWWDYLRSEDKTAPQCCMTEWVRERQHPTYRSRRESRAAERISLLFHSRQRTTNPQASPLCKHDNGELWVTQVGRSPSPWCTVKLFPQTGTAEPGVLSFISPPATSSRALPKCSAEVLNPRVQFHDPFDVTKPFAQHIFFFFGGLSAKLVSWSDPLCIYTPCSGPGEGTWLGQSQRAEGRNIPLQNNHT